MDLVLIVATRGIEWKIAHSEKSDFKGTKGKNGDGNKPRTQGKLFAMTEQEALASDEIIEG